MIFHPMEYLLFRTISCPPNSNIVIKIDTKIGRIINVEGQVIWAKTHTDRGSIMGIKFNKPNVELLRIYQTSESSSK